MSERILEAARVMPHEESPGQSRSGRNQFAGCALPAMTRPSSRGRLTVIGFKQADPSMKNRSRWPGAQRHVGMSRWKHFERRGQEQNCEGREPHERWRDKKTPAYMAMVGLA